MSTWECRGCTAAYAPGAPRCPQCGTDDPIKEDEQRAREQDMPKITVHGGRSNEDAEPGQPGYVEPADVEETGGDEPVTGDATEETEAPEPVDYHDFNVTDLRAELAERGLPVSGAKDELVARLEEDDKARADQAEQNTAE